MRYYLIRHIATGEYMPQAKKDRGYSHWNPSIPDNKFEAALGVPRLIDTRRRAAGCIAQWAANPNGRYHSSTNPYNGEWDDDVITKPDGRKKEDLEIVEVDIIECMELAGEEVKIDWGTEVKP